MQHYFATIESGNVRLSKEDEHHLLHVKRAQLNETIEISLPNGSLFRARVAGLSPLRIELGEEVTEKREGDIRVILAFSLLKGDHNDLIIQKGTELGVSEFYPVLSERTVVKPEGKEDKRLLRLRKIAEESAKQCRRNLVPTVHPYISYVEMLNVEADCLLLPYEGMLGASESLLSSLPVIEKGSAVICLIGPEGGFSDKEVSKAKERGYRFVSLGRRILRAETAAIYCASLLSAKMDS